MLAPRKKGYDKPRQGIQKQRHYFGNKCLYSQSYGFSSSRVCMWELDHKEDWAWKHWCFWTVVLEKTLVSPLGCKEIQPVHPKGDQSWMFISRTDDETGAPILWPPDGKSWLIRKHSDAGKDWRQEEKGMTEYAKVGWHLWFKGHEFEQAQGDGEGQGSLACYSPWGHKKSNTTELLNNNNKKLSKIPPWWLSVKESACNVGDLGLIPGLGRSPGEGKGYPLQYSGLENSMDCIVHGVAKSQTWLNDFHFTSHTP